MTPVRVIYEHGITAQVIDSQWHIINISGGQTEKISHPRIIAQRYKVRPILVTERSGNGTDIDILLRTAVADSFEIKIEEGEKGLYKKMEFDNNILLFDDICNIAYLLRATAYHCKQLALLYKSACDHMREISDLPGSPLRQSNFVIFSMEGAEIYYEFDALITAVRRAYESYRFLLWQFFGTNDHVPRNFCRTLGKCHSLPVELKEKLYESWSKHGEEIANYRDCIQHYVSLDYSLSSVIMHKLDNGAWSTTAPIPSNPLAKSRFKFVYDTNMMDPTVGRDALTYGWEAANEVLEVAISITDSIITS